MMMMAIQKNIVVWFQNLLWMYGMAWMRVRFPGLKFCSSPPLVVDVKTVVCVDCLNNLKGIVHPKMIILSSFTHPQVIPNLYEWLCSAEHKGRYSEECGKQSSFGAPLTSIVFIFLIWMSMIPQNSLVTNFLQNIFLCVQQNKDIHTGLELLEGE